MEPMGPEFAIVEIMGHRSHAGLVYETELFGGKMLCIETSPLAELPEVSRLAVKHEYSMITYDRDSNSCSTIEMPGRYVRKAVDAVPSRKFYYGNAAIFSVTPCSEEEAVAYERSKHTQGYEEWVPDALALAPAPPSDDDSDNSNYSDDEAEDSDDSKGGGE